MKLLSDCSANNQSDTDGWSVNRLYTDEEKEILLKFAEELKRISKIPKDDCVKCIWCEKITSFCMPIMDATRHHCKKYCCDIMQYYRNNPTGRITPCYKCECDQK